MAVPASPSRTRLSDAWWFRLAVRTILALLALWAVYSAENRQGTFAKYAARNFHMDFWLWLSWIGCAAAAGLLFGLAAWLPFTRVRYLWSRLLLAALAALPLADFWLGYNYPRVVHGWLVPSWSWRFFNPGPEFALAVLVGVAIASGLVAKGSEPADPAG
jgi:hypothetical protein